MQLQQRAAYNASHAQQLLKQRASPVTQQQDLALVAKLAGSGVSRRPKRSLLTHDIQGEALQTCHAILKEHPIRSALPEWDFWSCCAWVALSRELVLQRGLALYTALVNGIAGNVSRPESVQSTYHAWYGRECFEYVLFKMWGPVQSVGLADMATYLLADYALQPPQAAPEQ